MTADTRTPPKTDARDRADRTAGAAATDAVSVLVANPRAAVLEGDDGVWVIAGPPDEVARAAVAGGDGFEAVRTRLADTPGEYSLLHVDAGGVVRAHRGITSRHEVFYLRASDGTPVLTDQFRNAVSALDVADRTVTEAILADHLLYRTTPVGSYLAEVGRLGHGVSLRWDPDGGPPEATLREALAPRPTLDVAAAVAELDDALATLTPSASDRRLMLSGGVDSSLLGTYQGTGVPTVSGAYDSAELADEVEYARTAAATLGTDHRLIAAPEEAFLAHLESTIEAAGMPLQQIQTPMHDLVFRRGDADAYVSGILSDSLFGMGAGRARLVWLTRPLRHLPPVVSRLSTHREYARRLRRPPTDPTGYAAKTVQYQPLDLVAEVVGRSLAAGRQRVRVDYVRRRVPLPAPSADLATHLAWGHWIEYFCENTATSTRQVAQARGTAMAAPFAGRRVADVALALPSPERYVDRLEDKHVPKRLLSVRLPAYETGKPKGNGHLPERRFFREGPLADVFERYPMPSFVPDDLGEDLPERSAGLAWILASYAIWRDRVLRNDDVDPVPSTRTIEV